MWWFKKKKQEDPVQNYQMQFKITYHLSNGVVRSTSIINISVPAKSKEHAILKLRDFALRRVGITIVKCE